MITCQYLGSRLTDQHGDTIGKYRLGRCWQAWTLIEPLLIWHGHRGNDKHVGSIAYPQLVVQTI